MNTHADEPRPPYQMAETDLLITGVTFDEAELRRALPGGVEPADGCTGVIATYSCAACYPFGAYTGCYVSADVVGHDAADGSLARVMLACVYGPQPQPAALMSKYIGFPAIVGQTRLVRSDTFRSASTEVAERELFSVAMVVNENPTSSAGVMNWVRRSPGGLVVTSEPWVGRVVDATLREASLEDIGKEILKLPAVKSFDWASEISGAAFSFISASTR